VSAADADAAEDPRHPERALAADHALGLLEGAERDAFEAHLAGCAECREEARAYAETTALLAAALPPAAPPPGLRARILAEARRPQLVREVVRDDAPPASAPAGRRDLLGVDRPDPASAVRIVPPRRAAGRGGLAPWLAAAASLALAVGLGAGWARERAGRQRLVADEAARAAEQVERLRAQLGGQLAARTRQLAERDSAITALNTLVAGLAEPGVRVARLTATGEPEAMRLSWNRRRGIVVVTAAQLAAPEPGRVYQLWGIARGRQPQSLGVFSPGRDGTVRAVLEVPQGAAMDVAAVTVEPAGGSAQPTESPRMVGTIGAE
jgi:anti-sigma-K factor RskA